MDPARLPQLAWFAQIAQHGSFTKAAAEMNVSRAALSQKLKSLEDQVRVKLIYRTTREMSLTEEGQRLYDALRPALNQIDQALRGIGESQDEPSGLLKINTSRIAARTLVEPHLGEFHHRYPKLELKLVLDDGFSNIIADGCDAGIRMGESLAQHVVAIPISPMLEWAVVSSPDYFRRAGVPQSPDDLAGHNCVAYRHTTSKAIFRWPVTSPGPDGHAFVVEPQGNLITNDDDSMVRAALQGAGLVQHIDIVVRPYVEDGSLVRVLQKWCRPFAGFYLYVPSRDNMSRKVRAMIDFLAEKRRQSMPPVQRTPTPDARDSRAKPKAN